MTNGMSGSLESTDGTRIGWTRLGSGPPLVMVAGVMASRERAQQPALPAALAEHFTVFTYDRRGTGESVTQAPYTPEREFEDLHEVLNLAGDGACVYGFSSGATLALLAAAHGVPMGRLLLLEPPLVPDLDTSVRVEAERRLGLDRAAARRWFDVDVTGIPAEIRAQFAPPTEADLANAPAMLHELTFLPGTSADRFSPLRTPTLVMVSDHTAPVLLDSARRLGQAIPGALLRELPGGWHGVDDGLVVATIRDYLAASLASLSTARESS